MTAGRLRLTTCYLSFGTNGEVNDAIVLAEDGINIINDTCNAAQNFVL